MTIRSANESDIPLICKLAEHIWRACYPGIITHEQIEYMLRWMYSADTVRDELRKGITWEIVELDCGAIGFQSYHLEPDRRCKLNKLYLLPEHQGRGHATTMLRHILASASAMGATELWLQVNKRNKRAIAAYLKAGFVVAADKTFDIGGGFVMDDYLMSIPVTHPKPEGQTALDPRPAH